MDDLEEEKHNLLANDKEMLSKKFSTVDIRLPTNWIGSSLQGNSKQQFLNVRKEIDQYTLEAVSTENLIHILDTIEQIKSSGYDNSFPVLSEVVNYLRSIILGGDTDVIFHAVILLDCLMKNSGFVIHVLIGRRKFMKTLSLVARRHLADPSHEHKRLGVYMLDCIQAWGEAFYPREEYYPHIYQTYMKLRTKYKVKFPRPDFDPTRVPIFLGPVTPAERAAASRFNASTSAQYGSASGAAAGKEDAETAAAIARSLADVTVPPKDAIDFTPMERFSSGKGSRTGSIDSEHPAEGDAELEAALQASLMEVNLIDLGDSEEQQQQQRQQPFFTATTPTEPTFFPSSALQTPKQQSPEERILSLYTTPPTPAPGTLYPWKVSTALAPMTVTPPASQSKVHQSPSQARTQPVAWTPPPPSAPPLNPFDEFAFDGVTPEVTYVAAKAATNTPARAATAFRNLNWEMDGVWDLEALSAELTPPRPVSQPKASPTMPVGLLRHTVEIRPTRDHEPISAQTPAPAPALAVPLQALPSPPPTPRPPLSECMVGKQSGELTRQEQQGELQQALQKLGPPPPVPPPPAPTQAPKPADSSWNPAMEDSCAEAPSPWTFTAPPPVPVFPAPLPPSNAALFDDEALSAAIEAMSAPSPATSASSLSPSSSSSPSPSVIKLAPPPPGPVRAAWRTARAQQQGQGLVTAPASAAPGAPLEVATSLADTIQRTRAGLVHIEQRPRSSTVTTSAEASWKGKKGADEGTVFERFDPTAGPRPVVPTRANPPKKAVTFMPPSSDPDAEIRYYGHQRVVIRKPK